MNIDEQDGDGELLVACWKKEDEEEKTSGTEQKQTFVVLPVGVLSFELRLLL